MSVLQRIEDAMRECHRHHVDWVDEQYQTLVAAKAEIERLTRELEECRRTNANGPRQFAGDAQAAIRLEQAARKRSDMQPDERDMI